MKDFCFDCAKQGYCRFIKTTLVAESTLKKSPYLSDMKSFMRRHSFLHKITPENWIDHAVDLYRDYPGWIVGGDGQEIFLDLEILEAIPSRREWFRDFIEIVPDRVTPRLRKESVGRVQVIATILTACFPYEALTWGMRAANDNEWNAKSNAAPLRACPLR